MGAGVARSPVPSPRQLLALGGTHQSLTPDSECTLPRALGWNLSQSSQ